MPTCQDAPFTSIVTVWSHTCSVAVCQACRHSSTLAVGQVRREMKMVQGSCFWIPTSGHRHSVPRCWTCWHKKERNRRSVLSFIFAFNRNEMQQVQQTWCKIIIAGADNCTCMPPWMQIIKGTFLQYKFADTQVSVFRCQINKQGSWLVLKRHRTNKQQRPESPMVTCVHGGGGWGK